MNSLKKYTWKYCDVECGYFKCVFDTHTGFYGVFELRTTAQNNRMGFNGVDWRIF